MSHPSGCSRRQFLKTALAGAAGAAVLARLPAARGQAAAAALHAVKARHRAAGDKLNVALIGVGGQGGSNLGRIYGLGENIVALCDVDANHLNQAKQKVAARCPDARLYRDFRELFDKEQNLDAAVVTTPDHMHGLIAAWALERGLHVYCEKPLTRTLGETRRLQQLAQQSGAATQMGNHGSASEGLRRATEVVRAGVLGAVREVHVWTNRPIWPQGIARPAGSDPVPPELDWNLWLGVAPERPFKQGVYHPFKWRGWYDFGAGALGDMGCHTLNLPFHALRLNVVTSAEAVEVHNRMPESFPSGTKIRYDFPARGALPPLTLWWYDGNIKPAGGLLPEVPVNRGKRPGSGCYLIGEKGWMYSDDDYGARNFMRLNGEAKMVGTSKHPAAAAVPVTLPRTPGHHQEWLAACKGGPATFANFDTAAQLTEICLLGCLALRLGKKVTWDGPGLRAMNLPDAEPLIHPTYRTGWHV